MIILCGLERTWKFIRKRPEGIVSERDPSCYAGVAIVEYSKYKILGVRKNSFIPWQNKWTNLLFFVF